ncbi:MAG: glycosyltransferase family 2 protein [Flammeovirgaceae bacterium]
MIISIICYGVLSLFCLYILMTVVLIWGWKKMPTFELAEDYPSDVKYSIIIPVRNEAENILSLLAVINVQAYRNFEVIIVNDHSEDDTVSLVENYEASFPLQLIHVTKRSSSSPKKAAIQQAIEISTGSVIITTDGDCNVGKNWLKSIHHCYKKHQPVLISAGVTFQNEKNWFEKIQTIEFMSLIGAGAISIYFKSPNMCNGANLIYEKEAYYAVNGFAGSEHLASGDDEFLMHKIVEHFPNRIYFLKTRHALVHTQAQPSLKAFINQRKRWASKWNHYTNWRALALAVFIYSFHLANIISILLISLSTTYRWYIFGIFLIKVMIEFIYLHQILAFFGKGKLAKWIPLTQLLHSFYILLIGALGQLGGYAWKGRKLK